MSKQYKKVSTILNYTEHFLVLVFAITGGVSISVFASLVDTPIGITNSAVGLYINEWIKSAWVRKNQPIIKKKKKKLDKIVLSAKTSLNVIEVLISKALTYSYINYDEFVLVNNVWKEHDDMREKIINWTTETVKQIL